MVLNVTLSGGGQSKPLSSSWRFIGMFAALRGSCLPARATRSDKPADAAALRPALCVSVIADIAVTAAVAGPPRDKELAVPSARGSVAGRGSPVPPHQAGNSKTALTWLDLLTLYAALLRIHFSPAGRHHPAGKTSWKQAVGVHIRWALARARDSSLA